MQTVGFYSRQDYPRCHMTVLHTLWTRPASLLRWPTKQHTALKTDLSFYAAIEYKTCMAPNKLVIICSPIRIWNTWIWMSSRAKVSSHRTALIGHRLRSSAARHQLMSWHHRHNTSASRGLPIYLPAATHSAFLQRDGQAELTRLPWWLTLTKTHFSTDHTIMQSSGKSGPKDHIALPSLLPSSHP